LPLQGAQGAKGATGGIDPGLIIGKTYTTALLDSFIQALSLHRHPQREAVFMQSQGSKS
jgi:hypothetical protein